MPYLATEDGEEVIPPQVQDGANLRCPACNREMYLTSSHYRGESFVSQHFTHTPDTHSGGGGESSGGGTDCAGESPIHYKMKSIAYARLEEDYPEAEIELESGLAGRIPDVLLTFPEPRAPYGKGIAVEAQYRNKGKDIEGTTEHYFENSFSVVWLEEEDFSNHDVDLSGILSLWPQALPKRRGKEGYSKVIQWLWQKKRPSVEVKIPIPGEYWSSFDKTGEWVDIAKLAVKPRGNIRIAKSPTGSITLELGKSTLSGGENVQIQAFPSDKDKLKKFADELDRVVFGDERPPPEECEPKWHELTHSWLTGSENVTAWLSASLPSPKSDPVIQLGKKRGGESETVTMEVKPYASDHIRQIADLVEKAFAIENGDSSVL